MSVSTSSDKRIHVLVRLFYMRAEHVGVSNHVWFVVVHISPSHIDQMERRPLFKQQTKILCLLTTMTHLPETLCSANTSYQ